MSLWELLSQLDSGGTCHWSQHLGGRGKWISKFEASLVYKSEFQNSQGYTENPVSKNKKKKKKKKVREKKKKKKDFQLKSHEKMFKKQTKNFPQPKETNNCKL